MGSTQDKQQPLTGWQRTLVVGIDRLVHSFAVRWLAVFNSLAFLYVGLPVLAPILMNAGFESPARLIYTVYSPMCHQMAQRSFFLFGEQPVYPRELAGTEYRPIEDYVDDLPEFRGVSPDNWPAFFAAARSFTGNEQMGYKMALCERDVGIYGFIFIGGLLYGMLRRSVRINPLPLWAFLIIGMGPIAADGFSQLLGYWSMPLSGGDPSGIAAFFQSVLPLRESSPLMRAFTGAWFGLTLVWMAYPHVEKGMRETAHDLAGKLERADYPG
jgi:uncharacterized membrane protein